MNDLPIVYLGPSLPRAEAEGILRARYCPPVRRGDLKAVEGAPLVVVIDGEFGQNLSVSPKEILRLLDAGTRVLGASSMGALRAAELFPYGMEGHGWIFENYKSGRITGDDEVALAYSPIDQSPLTVPLVNVRRWLEILQAAGTVDGKTARQMFRQARGIFFADRTIDRLRDSFRSILDGPVLARVLRDYNDITDVKAADARLVLAYAASLSFTESRTKEHYYGNQEEQPART